MGFRRHLAHHRGARPPRAALRRFAAAPTGTPPAVRGQLLAKLLRRQAEQRPLRQGALPVQMPAHLRSVHPSALFASRRPAVGTAFCAALRTGHAAATAAADADISAALALVSASTATPVVATSIPC